MRIIICEDDVKERKVVKDFMKQLIKKEKLIISKLETFDDPFELIKEMTDTQEISNIYILDINLQAGMSGIEAAQLLREKDPDGKIIFLTSHEHFAIESINSCTEPYAFIVKELDHEHLKRLEKMILQIYQSNKADEQSELLLEERLSFIDSEKRQRFLRKKEVLYIENFSRSRKIRVNLMNDSFFVNTYISRIKKDFEEESFFFGHRSYIINLNQLEGIDTKKNLLRFRDGQFLFLHTPIIRKIQRQVNLQFE